MKISHSILAFTAISFLSFAACKKKTEVVVKPTGVLFCKINGTAWQSGPASSRLVIDGNAENYTTAEFEGDTLQLSGIHDKNDTSGIHFYVKVKKGKLGMVTGTSDAYFGGLYVKRFDFYNLVQALTDYTITYELNITKYDTTSKLISGTFIINQTGSKGTVKVTEGEFIDVKYKDI